MAVAQKSLTEFALVTAKSLAINGGDDSAQSGGNDITQSGSLVHILCRSLMDAIMQVVDRRCCGIERRR